MLGLFIWRCSFVHGYRVIILRAIVTCVVDVLAQAGIGLSVSDVKYLL